MDEELKEVFASMAEAMMEMKESILASTNQTAGGTGGVRAAQMDAAQMETNNILRTISQTLQEQLNFFRERESEREFEADTAQQEATAAKTEKAEGPQVDGKAGGLLGKIGIGIGAIAQGLALMGRPQVFVGIAAITLFTAAMGTVLALLAKFFAEAIGEMIYQLLFNIGRAIVDLGIMIGENKDTLMEANEVIADFVNKMVDIFADFLIDLIPLLESLMKGITKFAEKILPIIADFIEDMTEILIDGLVDIIGALEPIIEDFLDAFNEGFDTLGDIIEDILDTIGGLISDITGTLNLLISSTVPILQEFGNLMETVGGEIRATLTTIGNQITNLIQTVFGEARETAESFSESISGVVETVLGGIESIIAQIGETINSVLDNTTRNIQELSNIDGDALKNTAAGITAIAGAIALFAGSSLAGAAAGLGEAALGGLTKLFGGEGGGGVMSQLMRFAEIGPGINEAADAIERLAEVISNFGDTTFNASGLSSFADTMESSAMQIGDSMDAILGGGGVFGNRAGTAEERLKLLETLGNLTGGAALSGRPQPRGTEVETETARLSTAVREAGRETPSISNVQSDSIQDSFNTNQVYITSPGAIEGTLDRIFAEER